MAARREDGVPQREAQHLFERTTDRKVRGVDLPDCGAASDNHLDLLCRSG
jgi:hypothetical protein